MTAACTRHDHSQRTGVFHTATALFAIACSTICTAAGRAEDDVPVDDVPPGVVADQRAQRRQNAPDMAEQFNNNLFHQTQRMLGRPFATTKATTLASGASGSSTESQTVSQLRTLGETRLARIEAVGGLSEAQRRKLRLAMESDVRRLAEEIDAARQKYQGQAANSPNQAANQRLLQQFNEDLHRCRGRMISIFGDDSLLMKILPTTLDPEQQARLTAETDGRRAALWQSMVASAMLKVDDIAGFDQTQYEAIEKLLLERQPPLRIEGFAYPHQIRQFSQMLVWMALVEIDAQQLQAGMSERQADMLARFAMQGKQWKPNVASQGLLEKVVP